MADDEVGAVGNLWVLLVGGIVLQLAGGLAAGIGWPGTEPPDCTVLSDTGEPVCQAGEETGNLLQALLGIGLASVGVLMAFVGVVGFGVYLGMQAHRSRNPREL